jgi:cellulose synthase operon protein C
MLEVQAPLLYNFAPGEFGSFSFTATPTYISAGTINNDETQLRRFGRNALSNKGVLASPGDINDSGIALSAGFNAGWVQVDLGVTPLGFLFTNPVGGITFRSKLSEVVTLRFTIEQRAVTDNVLSYAGVTDTRKGITFGGVVKRCGSLGIEVDTGDFGAYANVGFYQFEGQRVKDNRSIEGNMGTYIRIIERPDEELKIGGNVSFFGYEENLRHFTLGYGGYFSLQSYFLVSTPIEYTRREGPMSYAIGGSIGIQRFDEETADVFPGQAGNTNLLFQRLNAVGNPLVATALTQHVGQETTSIGFSAFGRMEYVVSEKTTVGVGARLDGAADWFEGTAVLFLRQALGGSLYGSVE